MLKKNIVLKKNLIGLGIAAIGIIINLNYFVYEFLTMGESRFVHHFFKELLEHMTILSLIIIFPVVGYFVNHNISERDKSQKKLKEQTDFISSVLNTVSLSIFTIDPDYRIKTYNEASHWLFGYNLEGVVGKSVKFLFNNSNDFITVMEEVNKNGNYNSEVFLKSEKGVIPCFLSVRALLNDTGDIRAYIFVARDISAEKEKEELKNRIFLAEKLASIGKLAAGIAHEINNPLTSASLITESLIEKYSNISELNSRLLRIKNRVDVASRIAREMLDISRRTKPELRNMNLREILNDAIETLEIPDNVEIKISMDKVRIFSDYKQLRRIFINLILNAIQAMPDGGKIEIYAIELEDRVIIRISDTGSGIKREIIDKIFDPFFSTRDVGEGTGLGLFIVHELIDSFNGVIDVESDENKGTTFIITLPKN